MRRTQIVSFGKQKGSAQKHNSLQDIRVISVELSELLFKAFWQPSQLNWVVEHRPLQNKRQSPELHDSFFTR